MYIGSYIGILVFEYRRVQSVSYGKNYYIINQIYRKVQYISDSKIPI